MFFSLRLAFLASFLSPLVLPCVNAAYPPSRHPAAQNFHQISPGLPTSRFGHHSPISDRHRAHIKGWHTRGRAPKSTLPRHRYRHESDTHDRRSSVYVIGESGNKYLVSRSRGTNVEKSRSQVHDRRQIDQNLGRIDIMDTAESPDSPQRLASLAVNSTPTNWISGQNTTKVFGVNASTTNRTQFIMMVLNEQPSNMSSNKHVSLGVQVFDAHTAETVMYCATYDPDPAAASAIVMAPCTTSSVALAPVSAPSTAFDNATDTTSPSDPHQSQTFSYDPFSGQIQPVTSVVNTEASEHAECDSEQRRDVANSTISSNTIASNTQTSARPTPTSSPQARNVTLVYIPEDIEVPASSRSLRTTENAERAVVTTTITTTVIATVTASAASSKSPTPARAAASPSTSATNVTTLVSTRSATLSTSVSKTASPKSSSSVASESLEIEIINVPPTTTASSPSVPPTTSTRSRTSTTLNAQSVASSVANARSSVVVSRSTSSSSATATATATPVVVSHSRRSRMFGRM